MFVLANVRTLPENPSFNPLCYRLLVALELVRFLGVGDCLSLELVEALGSKEGCNC